MTDSLLNAQVTAPGANATAPSGMLRFFVRSFVFASLMAAAGAHAQSQFDGDVDDNAKPWQETTVQLPPAPLQHDLLPFYVSPLATQSFAIDAKSLAVGSDGVIRYTLVAVSSAGARNVSYEGIRCATHESKVYAFGQADGSWARSHHGQWRAIHGYGPNRPRAALATDYFCRELTIAGKAEDMIARIRNQRTLAPQQNGQ